MDLSLSLSQKLALSQKMQQSAEILQMSSAELSEYIKELSIENPVVEYEEQEEQNKKFDILKKKMDWMDASDEQNKTYYQEDKEEEDSNDIWNFRQSQGESLENYLLSQVNVLHMEPLERTILHYLIESMDTNGYLEDNPFILAQRLHVKESTLRKSLSVIQALEPAGVGAFSLKECLLLQLKRQENPCLLAEKIIQNELEALGKNQIPQIAKRLKVKTEDVIVAYQQIKKLNPKPGNSFVSNKNLDYVVPDVVVTKEKDNFKIILNNMYQPQIKINQYYKTIMNMKEENAAKEYVYHKIKQAEWVIQCITKRNTTLMKTMEVIVVMQKSFFEKGPGNLYPMRLCDVAQKIEMHESTVSRTIREKYLQCSWGVLPLHYFFSTGITTSDSNKMTPDRIKQLIKEIIEKENKQSPFSDREITEKLNTYGIEISRRTVTKYREAINIPGTTGRKSF